jgi:hypothetical protein
MYQKKVAYGRKGFPWVKEIYPGNISYEKGICPVAEDLQDRAMMGLPLCLHNYSDPETDLVIRAFHKVWNQLDVLRHLDRK